MPPLSVVFSALVPIDRLGSTRIIVDLLRPSMLLYALGFLAVRNLDFRHAFHPIEGQAWNGGKLGPPRWAAYFEIPNISMTYSARSQTMTDHLSNTKQRSTWRGYLAWKHDETCASSPPSEYLYNSNGTMCRSDTESASTMHAPEAETDRRK